MTAIEARPIENRFLTWTDWAGYQKILEVFEDRPIRVTYDRGRLEIMSPSRKHEHLKKLLGHMIESVMVERDVDFTCGGSTTFRRQDLDRGLEPDDCYWISSYPAVADMEQWDPAVHPPPDLVIEAEVSRSALDRMGIYAALGVPEVWRVRADGTVEVHRLDEAGRYQAQARSGIFPWLSLEEISRHLRQAGQMSDAKLLRSFREWVRAQPR